MVFKDTSLELSVVLSCTHLQNKFTVHYNLTVRIVRKPSVVKRVKCTIFAISRKIPLQAGFFKPSGALQCSVRRPLSLCSCVCQDRYCVSVSILSREHASSTEVPKLF